MSNKELRRFDRLLHAMTRGAKARRKREAKPATSVSDRDEDSSDTETRRDTKEDT